MLSSAHSFSTADRATREHELKLLLTPRRTSAVLAYLRSVCRSDPLHPANRVSSVYFEDPQGSSLDEKLNSDLFKTKVRLRWYEDPVSGQRSNDTFVEVKYRLGQQRHKERVKTPFRGDQLANLPLDDPAFCSLPLLLREVAPGLPVTLQPLLQVEYQRARFLDPATRSRVSVDTHIRVARINTHRLPCAHPAPVSGTVIEVKNHAGSMPQSLRLLTRFGARKESFSKYAACFHAAITNVD